MLYFRTLKFFIKNLKTKILVLLMLYPEILEYFVPHDQENNNFRTLLSFISKK